LEQWDYRRPLSTELRDSPLWLLSEGTLSWLIENKRDTPSFLDILAIILQGSLPSVQVKIWRMMHMDKRLDNGAQNQVETDTFEKAWKVRNKDNKYHQWNSEEQAHYWCLSDLVSQQRDVIEQRNIDVRSLGILHL